MRQRKAKNMEERLARLQNYMVEEPQRYRGNWRALFHQGGEGVELTDAPSQKELERLPANDAERENDQRASLFLEIGCGKGQFILAHGRQNPDGCYVAVEGQNSVILRALEKAEAAGSENVLFVCDFVRDIRDWFEAEELDGIYLNFSDPWPKKRHRKRRLTYGEYLLRYRAILKPGGFMEIKTDNDGLFAFTMEEIQRTGLKVQEYSNDLHSSVYTAKEFMTEYEEKFHDAGKNIHYVKIIK